MERITITEDLVTVVLTEEQVSRLARGKRKKGKAVEIEEGTSSVSVRNIVMKEYAQVYPLSQNNYEIYLSDRIYEELKVKRICTFMTRREYKLIYEKDK